MNWSELEGNSKFGPCFKMNDCLFKIQDYLLSDDIPIHMAKD